MTNAVATVKALPHGLNETAILYAEAVCPGVVSAGGTLTLSPGDGVPVDAVPIHMQILRPTSPLPNLYVEGIGAEAASTKPYLTSYDDTTGTVIITVPASTGTPLAAGDVVYLVYAQNK